MGAEAPQWLVGAFADALSEVGATADRADREAEARTLIEMWNAPGRTAHNYRHLIHVLTLIDELADTAHDADLLRLAAWYHGACVTPAFDSDHHSPGSDARSGSCEAVTRARLEALGTPGDVIDRVAELLGHIGHHSAPVDDPDAQVLVDADLGRLALSPQEFAKYRQALREEYAAIDDGTYYRARRRTVMELLGRDSIFYTNHASAWEEVARSNLELELARIDEQIRKLCPSLTAEESDADNPDLEAPAAPVGVAPTPEHDEDLISDDCVHATHATVFKRRSVKPCPSEAQEELVTTGVLPALNAALVEDTDPSESRQKDEAGSNLSSLESAIDTLGLS